MNGGRNVTTGKSVALVHAEQRPLAHGLVAHVGVRMIVRRQRIALVMVQPVAIGADARHEDVTMQIVAAGPRRGFHLRGRGAVLPVVHIVVNDVEASCRPARASRPPDRSGRP